MDRKALLEQLYNEPQLQQFQEWLKANHSFLLEELWEGAKTFFAALALHATKKNILLLTSNSHFAEDWKWFFPAMEPLEFPSWDMLPGEGGKPPIDVVGERFRLLQKMQERGPHMVIASLQAVLEKVVSPKTLESNHLKLNKGMSIPFSEIPAFLESLGYRRESVAAEKGEFALRGGILDIFPVTYPEPYRIEFWEDEIVSLRSYDPNSQLSQKKVEEVLITPAEELKILENREKQGTLLDYLGKETLVIFDDLVALEDKYVLLKQSMAGSFPHTFLTISQFFTLIEDMQKLYYIPSPLKDLSEAHYTKQKELTFSFFDEKLKARLFSHPLYPLFPTFCPREIEIENFRADDFLKTILSFPVTACFLSANDSEEQSVVAKIEGIPTHAEAKKHFLPGYLTSGFFLKEQKIALIPHPELTGRYRLHRTSARSHYHALAHEVFSLTSGEFVVHMQSGIGRYLGIEKRANHLGIETEFLLLEYAEGSKLYVPMEQASQLTKYIGVSEESPSLHTLGSTKWQKLKEKTEQAILDYASDLLELQAERMLKEGFVYPPHSALTNQFNEEFPYTETADQKLAILKVYEDMMSKRPMDRLICGDVGYGKTEVAMRAAIKAVIDGGKQVAVLVPTTVLALQHFENFSARMEGFPLRIEQLSRFRTAKENKKTLDDLNQGLIDIVIGTHRLISSDVAFKNLGLVIIDEEQRFGVKAKEHLKKLKTEVDCLTLSATPIPRTLYLSLVGVRDMSVINTPPSDRLPIQSAVAQYSEELIQGVLLRELARGGQAYVIHNRVETIYGLADKLRQLIPQARLVVGHGQMDGEELDRVFHAFKSGQADILVATSIIENGIDIPNANTILIDRADRFGLADLYQMRGRVGRWNKKAYCYFLVPSVRDLSADARKRLQAISEASGYGGGMKIAMRDLEIRGAGNILNVQQSGHIAEVGFHLYCKLLKKTLHALKNRREILFTGTLKMEFPFDARLPEEYINEASLRMEFYQRLGDAEEESEIEAMDKELTDRFGAYPPAVAWLLSSARLRLFAEPRGFTLLRLLKGTLYAVQKFDKQKRVEKTVAIQPPKTPKELEERLLAALRGNFTLPF